MPNLETAQFDYHLPIDRIAQHPAVPRDHSRLLHIQRSTQSFADRFFYELPQLLKPSDLLVLNNSRVIPARLMGKKVGTQARIEALLIRERSDGTWDALTKPGKRLRTGSEIFFDTDVRATIMAKKADGICILRFNTDAKGIRNMLHRIGLPPLPPYITEMNPETQQQYQTIFASVDGSIAAPTAGLHFTEDVFAELSARNIETAFVTLHVGPGTFLPVKTNSVIDHQMHSEDFSISETAARQINAAKREGRRIVAVGTTTTRVLESASKNGTVHAGNGSTKLFITPGFKFETVDALITNFHLPKSTLLMLVCAFAGPGVHERDLVFRAYEHAITHQYRFYSFGDAMCIE